MRTNEFNKYIQDNNLEYKVLRYDESIKKYHIKHLSCSHEYVVTFSHFVTKGRRCPKCNGGVKYTHEEFVNIVKNRVGGEYTVLGEYINSYTKIKMKHNICGKEFEIRPVNFIAKSLSNRCPYCFKNFRKTTKNFKNEVFELVGNDYTLLSEYKNNKTKVKFRHNICGNVYEVVPKDFIKKNGNRCPVCSKSKGEDTISKWLTSKKIPFTNGYKIDDCRNVRTLEFDFKIDLNDEKYVLLEFDGRLHFEPWKEGKKHIEHLERQQFNDKIKNEYCEENSIVLYRINYLEDIEKRLNEIFSTSTTIESTSDDGSE